MRAKNYLRIKWLVEAVKAVNVFLDGWQKFTAFTRSSTEQLVIDDACNEIRQDLDKLLERTMLL